MTQPITNPTPATNAKGRLIAAQGGVSRFPGTVRWLAYRVVGDHATYRVIFDGHQAEWRCDCPARVTPCSHICAVAWAEQQDVVVDAHTGQHTASRLGDILAEINVANARRDRPVDPGPADPFEGI